MKYGYGRDDARPDWKDFLFQYWDLIEWLVCIVLLFAMARAWWVSIKNLAGG